MCYNGANEKPLPVGEVAAQPTERVRLWNETPSHPLSRELSQRESLKTRATLGAWALPEAFVKQMRNRRDKNRRINKNLTEVILWQAILLLFL